MELRKSKTRSYNKNERCLGRKKRPKNLRLQGGGGGTNEEKVQQEGDSLREKATVK